MLYFKLEVHVFLIIYDYYVALKNNTKKIMTRKYTRGKLSIIFSWSVNGFLAFSTYNS